MTLGGPHLLNKSAAFKNLGCNYLARFWPIPASQPERMMRPWPCRKKDMCDVYVWGCGFILQSLPGVWGSVGREPLLCCLTFPHLDLPFSTVPTGDCLSRPVDRFRLTIVSWGSCQIQGLFFSWFFSFLLVLHARTKTHV